MATVTTDSVCNFWFANVSISNEFFSSAIFQIFAFKQDHLYHFWLLLWHFDIFQSFFSAMSALYDKFVITKGGTKIWFSVMWILIKASYYSTILSRSMMCFVLAYSLPDMDSSTPARQRMVLFNAEYIAFVVFGLPLNTLSNAPLMTISAFDILVVGCGKIVRKLLRYSAPFVSFKCVKVRWFEWWIRIRIQYHTFFESTTNFFYPRYKVSKKE